MKVGDRVRATGTHHTDPVHNLVGTITRTSTTAEHDWRIYVALDNPPTAYEDPLVFMEDELTLEPTTPTLRSTWRPTA